MTKLEEWINIWQLFHPGHSQICGVLYYDESNIFHKLKLTPTGTNNDLCNQNFFILGGLYLPKEQSLNTDSLYNSLSLQPTSKELYFSLLTSGKKDFWDVTRSKKMQTFFQWLVDNNVLIHYSIVDYLYYSIIDIVDSLPSIKKLPSFNRIIKDIFHQVASQNITDLMIFFYEYGYPNLEQSRVKEFVSKLINFLCANYNPELHNQSKFNLLINLLDEVSESTELIFLQTQTAHLLFEEYESLYIDLPSRMKNGEHIFDRVEEIEAALSAADRNYSRKLNFKMVDSKENKFLQFSDVLVGFIRSLTMFLFSSTRSEVIDFTRSLDLDQRRLIQNFYLLHNRSVKVSPFLYHFIAPDNILEKNRLLVSVATFG